MKKSENIRKDKDYYNHVQNPAHLQVQIKLPAKVAGVDKKRLKKYECRHNKTRQRYDEF